MGVHRGDPSQKGLLLRLVPHAPTPSRGAHAAARPGRQSGRGHPPAAQRHLKNPPEAQLPSPAFAWLEAGQVALLSYQLVSVSSTATTEHQTQGLK